MDALQPNEIKVVGARVHNLRDVSLTLRKNSLICFTGVSGSGKSSLAFDTLYAEGQRRYIESLSAYARQFLGQLPKPDVDQITGLAPAISIQQKTSGGNPRSTVGTLTQIQDYLRVLWARAGTQRCTQCGRPIAAQTREQMIAQILALPPGTRFLLLAPLARQQRGEFRDLFADLLHQGFVRARVNGAIIELAEPPALDRYKRHDVEVVVDRLEVRPDVRSRLADALDTALSSGQGTAIVAPVAADDDLTAPASGRRGGKLRELLLSASSACTACGLSFESPSPQMLSFNSPQGMCPNCDGLGVKHDFDAALLIPDPTLNLTSPCVAAWRGKPGHWRRHLYAGVATHLGVELKTPWADLPAAAQQALLYGTGDAHITYVWQRGRNIWKHGGTFEGIIPELHAKYRKATSPIFRRFYEQFMRQADCQTCHGARLTPTALAVTVTGRVSDGGKPQTLNIHEFGALSIDAAREFCARMELDAVRRQIAAEPLKEILARLKFLLDVGLNYLTLNRGAPTLAGGEAQRIRLASQIGSGLVGVLYVLDEPSIGLHPRDNRQLLAALQRLRDLGNTVVVVEHDRDTMEAADELVDFGPGAGSRGGHVVARGTVAEVAATPGSLTGAYLAGRETIPIPAARRPVKPPGRTRSPS